MGAPDIPPPDESVKRLKSDIQRSIYSAQMASAIWFTAKKPCVKADPNVDPGPRYVRPMMLADVFPQAYNPGMALPSSSLTTLWNSSVRSPPFVPKSPGQMGIS